METFSHIVGRIEDFPRKKLDQKCRFSSYEHIGCQKSMGLLTKEVVCKDKRTEDAVSLTLKEWVNKEGSSKRVKKVVTENSGNQKGSLQMRKFHCCRCYGVQIS